MICEIAQFLGGGRRFAQRVARPLCQRSGDLYANRRLADEIKSLKRPPTMMEVRTIAHKLFGKHFGSSVYDILKNDWNKYGLTVVKGDTLAQKLVVSLEQKSARRAEKGKSALMLAAGQLRRWHLRII
jgi:hypothetical protein